MEWIKNAWNKETINSCKLQAPDEIVPVKQWVPISAWQYIVLYHIV